jgi:hypothetical protein
MNKIFTQLFLGLLFFGSTYAQVPNMDFENWRGYTDQYGTGELPTGWYTTDSTLIHISYGTSGHSAIKELTDKCSGTYSLKLISVAGLGQKAPGVATNGIINGIVVDSVKGGSPHTIRSAKLTGCYKYVPYTGDTSNGKISAVLTKWNVALSKRDTIASTAFVAIPSGGLINFQTDFNYSSASDPDTALILLQSGPGINQTIAGTYLIVDNLAFVGVIGIDEISHLSNVKIFPQPAQNTITIEAAWNQNISLTYEIADITGRRILSGKMESTKQHVDVNSLSRGNYFVALRNEQGAILHTSKLIVSK